MAMDPVKMSARPRPPAIGEMYVRSASTVAAGDAVRIPPALRGRNVRFYAQDNDFFLQFAFGGDEDAAPSATMNTTNSTASVLASDGTPAASTNASFKLYTGYSMTWELPSNCIWLRHKSGTAGGQLIFHLADNGAG